MRHRSPIPPLVRMVTGPVCLLLVALGLGVLGSAPAAARDWPGHPGRDIVRHVVQPGDTATGLAVRYHAWTAELLALNGLTADSYLRVGETLRIPVVEAAVRADEGETKPDKGEAEPDKADKPRRTPEQRAWDRKMRANGWDHWRHRRPTVKKLIAAEARKHGVPVRLAQAVGWMESGWHQPVVSSAGAIGVMQVLPTTGTWMSMYAGRPLNLRNAHDNITAGVLLLKVLGDHTDNLRDRVGAYYQGLGAVQRNGLYDETVAYVDTVLALRAKVRHIAN